MHAADLSGPCKPSSAVRWSRRIAEEFFLQGERERELGLRVSDGFDRECAGGSWAVRNAAFIEHVVRPLYGALHAAAPGTPLGLIVDAIDDSLDALGEADEHLPCDTPRRAAHVGLAD
mgnify:CR=1 FL=1